MERPKHPGDVLRERLRPLGLRQTDLARLLGVTATRVNELVNRRREVTAEIAVRLAELCEGTTAEWWMQLQVEHDLWRARRARAEEKERKETRT